jgi:hypothetical protein
LWEGGEACEVTVFLDRIEKVKRNFDPLSFWNEFLYFRWNLVDWTTKFDLIRFFQKWTKNKIMYESVNFLDRITSTDEQSLKICMHMNFMTISMKHALKRLLFYDAIRLDINFK